MTPISVLSYVAAAGAAMLAVVGLLRARRTVADWAFTAMMLALAADRTLAGRSMQALTLGEVEDWQQWRLLTLTLLPASGLLFAVTYARGNAVAFLRRWKLFLGILVVTPAALAVVLHERLFVGFLSDIQHSWILRLGWGATAVQALVLVSSVLVLMHLERTYRASVALVRWRIKFMLMGVGVLFLVLVYTVSQALLFRALDSNMEAVTSIGTLVALLLVLRGWLRQRSSDTSVYPSLAVLQSSVTVLFVGVYLFIVGVLARVATYVGGDAAFALKAFVILISLVVLGIVLQSDRIRLYLRRFISRHFRRPIYDYRSVWMAFTQKTSSCVEQAELCRSIVKLTSDLFEALSVGMWLATEDRDSFVSVASTSMCDVGTERRTWPAGTLQEMAEHFRRDPSAVDLDVTRHAWATTLRELHPSSFRHGGDRVCVPILRRDELVGFVVIGDRVNGIPFTPQDLDLLKCIAHQASASLLNVQLSQRLVQAKELEAFQSISAFFIHDLKNSASTLNLMLRNLPANFDDPAFREDALRGIAKTVAHINGLIGRLGVIRRDLKLRPVEADLNEIVTGALAGLGHSDRYALAKDLSPLPKLMLDRDQLQKVVTNLVLNATEAVSEGGQIRVSTSGDPACVVLTVADNGCGMSNEFLRQSLFRPFKTTKKDGLGIGMFQSRLIVEAHGGRMAVTSECGKGTEFQVFLPTNRQT